MTSPINPHSDQASLYAQQKLAPQKNHIETLYSEVRVTQEKIRNLVKDLSNLDSEQPSDKGKIAACDKQLSELDSQLRFKIMDVQEALHIYNNDYVQAIADYQMFEIALESRIAEGRRIIDRVFSKLFRD